MINTLDDICSKLSEEMYYNEEHVRVCIVLRILYKLGWDIWNPTEVNTEFKPVRQEDSTRVDIALFCSPISPAVFVEVKAVGKMEVDLPRIEQQLRDYNRNNTAEFSIITDGRRWRLYYSQTGGEFSKKLFKEFDLLKDDPEDLARMLQLFLSKESILNGEARQEATTHLRFTKVQQLMEELLPKAKRMSQEPPFPRLPDALVSLLEQSGEHVSQQATLSFITDQAKKQTSIEPTIPGQHIGSQVPSERRMRKPRSRVKLPPDGITCRFRYAGQTYNGRIVNGSFQVDGYGEFGSLSGASVRITETSRDGWRDWELQLPDSTEWILAQSWRDNQT